MIYFNRFYVGLLVIGLLLVTSCGEATKMLKSKDIKEQYDFAERMYESGQYRKANLILSQITPKYIGKPQGERVMFFLADSYYQLKDYQLASYQFERFLKSYPQSEKAEQAAFFGAKSYYHLSPKYSLDQTDTDTALDKLQVFINMYPESGYLSEANVLAKELTTKKEQKAFEIAKQYNRLGSYNLTVLVSAVKALDNFLMEYPGSVFREDAWFYKLESQYTMAINSTPNKIQERLQEAMSSYQSLIKYFPNTKHQEKAEQIAKQIEKQQTKP